MAWLEKNLIRRSALGLFHCRETYNTYAPYCPAPELVHDIHIARQDHITASSLADKIEGAHSGPLRICYAGRAEPMKGSLDWIEVLEKLSTASVDFRAVWLGDGSEYPEKNRRVANAGLQDVVELPGNIADRQGLLKALRDSQLFLFCHKTPESPRCLIEALVSGCPIVGYGGAFARDLVSTHGGGLFAPMNDTGALAGLVAALAHDRTRFAELIASAAQDGFPFEDVAVFRHRSTLIKKYL